MLVKTASPHGSAPRLMRRQGDLLTPNRSSPLMGPPSATLMRRGCSENGQVAGQSPELSGHPYRPEYPSRYSMTPTFPPDAQHSPYCTSQSSRDKLLLLTSLLLRRWGDISKSKCKWRAGAKLANTSRAQSKSVRRAPSAISPSTFASRASTISFRIAWAWPYTWISAELDAY